MMLKSLLLVAAALFVFAPALQKKDEKKELTKVSGFLIDNVCAEAAQAEEGEEGEEAESHMVSCALMEACVKSGYSVVSEGRRYTLDEKGNKLALRLLRDTRVRQGLTVTVSGTLDGDTLRAELITESR